MKKSRNQNPIYIATTISVYLGLVLVGASPQVLAQSSFAGDAQSRIFQFASKNNNVLSKLKLRQEQDDEKSTVLAIPGTRPLSAAKWSIFRIQTGTPAVYPAPFISNEQVLTVSVLPRASL